MDDMTITLTRQKSLREIVRDLLEDAGGLTEPATEALRAMLDTNPALRDAVAHEAVNAYAAQLVDDAMRTAREEIWRTASARLRPQTGGPQAPKTSVAALANGIRESLLDFPLRGGLRLRHATHEDVVNQAAHYSAAARDMGRKARWLGAVAARLSPGERVGDVLTEADLAALFVEGARDA